MAKRTLFLILMLSTSIGTAFAEVKIVATLPWIGSIAREIGKDRANVTVLVKPNRDPQYVEAKPSMILAASKADVIMYNGLDLEAGYLSHIITSSRNPDIQPGRKGNLDCSQYVEPIEKPRADIDRSMGDVHPLGNPHFHYSARRPEKSRASGQRSPSKESDSLPTTRISNVLPPTTSSGSSDTSSPNPASPPPPAIWKG